MAIPIFPEGKRRIGSPRETWRRTASIERAEMGCGSWHQAEHRAKNRAGWRADAQLKSNTSVKSVIPVHKCQILEYYKNFRKPPNTFENFPGRGFPKFSEHFRTLPKISGKFRKSSKLSEDRFENFSTFPIFPKTSEDFRKFPKTSEDFQRFKNSKNAEMSF